MKLGLYNKRGEWVPFRSKRQTTLFVGKRGTGKTETLKRLALNDIHAERPVVYFGDDSILDYMPRKHTNVVLFDPTKLTFKFNVLHSSPQLILEAIQKLWPSDVATVRINSFIGAGLISLKDTGANLFNIIDLLTDKDYRKNIDVLKDFWDRFEVMSAREQRDKTESSISRLQSFSMSDHVRDTLSATENKLSFKDKWVVVSLKPSEIGTENARLLGALTLAHLAYERPNTTLYMDGYVPGVSLVLERCPSIPVFLAVQSLSQLGKEKEAVMSAAQIVAFRTTKKDADELEPEFYLDTQSHLNTQPDHEAYIARGFGFVKLYMPLHSYPKTKQRDRIVNYSRKHYG